MTCPFPLLERVTKCGYSSKDAATEMAALSSQFAQISPGMDVDLATDGLVSTMKAFHYDVVDVESEIMDTINRAGNTMATNNEEIVEMLKRSSAAMSAANNSLRETIALESAAVQITRNAETTGTAFRTISMRIRGYDEETEEYIGGVEELSGKIADLTKTASNPRGISLFTDETKTTYKSTYQILKDISEIYNELSDADQAALLEKLAGKRGGQVLAGILEDFSEVERAMGEIEKSAGSADAEMSIVEESIDYKLNNLKQTWVGILQELIDNGDLGRLIDALTAISEALGEIITTAGPIPSVILGLGLRELVLNLDKIPQALTGVKRLVGALESLEGPAKSAEIFIGETADAVNSLESASKSAKSVSALPKVLQGILSPAGLVVTALAAVGAAIYSAVKANNELRRSAKSLSNVYSSAESDIDSYKTKIQNLYEIINDESSSYEQSKDAREKLLQIQDELISKYGKEAESIQLITDAIDGEIGALEKLTDIQWQNAINEFNEQNLPGWDWLNRWSHQADDNVGVMLSEMEDTFKHIYLDKKDFEFAQEMADLFGGTATLSGNNAILSFSGNLDDIYDKIFAIQNLARNNDDIGSTSMKNINTAVSSTKELLDLYGSFYNQYVMNERVFGTDYEGVYNNIVNDYKDYKNALVNEDSKAAEESKNAIIAQYAAMKSAMMEDGEMSAEETSIYNALAALIPELQNELNANVLKIHLELDTEEVNSEKEEIAGLIKDFGNEESLSGYIKGTDTALDEKYEQLEKYAKAHGISIKDLIALYRELNLLEGFETRNTDILANRYKEAIGVNGTPESIAATKEAFSAISDETYEIAKNFGAPQWKEVNAELRQIAGTTDVAKAGADSYQKAIEAVAQRWQEVKEVSHDAADALDAAKQWEEERFKALEKLGLAKEVSGEIQYDESWTNYLETIKALNPEIANNEYEVEKCALANLQFSKAIDDLSKNFNTYKEALKDADKLTPEYSDAINALADDLTYLTGISFSIEDAADFLGTAENVELLEKALNGSDEALQQLQANAEKGVYIRVNTEDLKELQIELGLNTDEFNAELNNFLDWLDTADLGTLEAQTYLNEDPFIQALIDLAKQSSEMAEKIKAIFKDLGWDIKWDTTKMKVPTTESWSGKKNDDVHVSSIYAPGGAQQVNWKYDELDVPTNIRFVGKNSNYTGSRKTGNSSYTPSSLSPAQKATAKQNIDKANGSDSKKDEYKEFIDYFERMIKVLDQSVDLLEAHLEDVVGSFAKNNLLDAEEDLIQKKMNGYSSAIDMYSQKASEALSKIPSDIAAKLLQGAVDIDEFVGKGNKEVVEAIQEYEKWADKVQDCRLNIVQLKEAIRQLELQKFNNVMKDFTDQFDLRQSAGIDLISKQIDLLKEAGELVGESFYQKQIDQANKQLQILSNEQAALVQQMNEALSNGIDRGSEEWLEMVNALTDVEGKIIDCKKSIEEFDNAILALHTEIFNRIQDQFAAFNNELSNMRELIADDSLPVATVDNKWTDEGITQLGLLTQEYELARYQVGQFDQEIEKLNADYLAGRYSATEYADALIDLKERQWDAVNAAESAKEAIVDLNKARVDIVVKGINEEIEAYRKLIEAQKDALAAEKDLHDYRKQIAESNKTITDLERQLAAMADDDTAATVAKRKKLEEQLAEARENLDEQEYSHSIESQQDALDKQLEAYEELRQKEIESLQESLLNEELVIAESFERVRENSQLIGETILATAQQHGIEMSQALTDSWFTGENAVAHYGEVLSDATSAFIGNLQGVEYETYELQNKANETAEGLANMFATRADSLVDELVRSYTGEANLDAMTNALHDSLSRTIDGNYSGASAAAALDSIADAANGVADAAEAAARALREMTNAQDEYDWEAYQRAQQEENMLASQSAKRNHYTSIYGGDNAGKVAVWKDRNGSYTFRARGSKSIPHDELAWTQENGPEMILSPTTGAILTPLSRGDAVLPTDQTANIWEWSKFDPSEFAKKLVQSMPNAGANVQANTMQVGSLVTVNGNVNDSMEMMQIASTTASAKIKQSFKELSNGINK